MRRVPDVTSCAQVIPILQRCRNLFGCPAALRSSVGGYVGQKEQLVMNILRIVNSHPIMIIVPSRIISSNPLEALVIEI